MGMLNALSQNAHSYITLFTHEMCRVFSGRMIYASLTLIEV